MDLTREFLEKVEEMANVERFEIEGGVYTSKKLYRVEPLRASTMFVNTLDSLWMMLKAENGSFVPPYFVTVNSPVSVSVYSGLLEDMQREVPYSAEATLPKFEFGKWIPVEEMIIALKSKFIQNEDTEKLVALLGNITNMESIATKDDGFTQNVEARKGISMKNKIDVKPIVKLKPYRTFLEVEQPESEFLFRIREDGAALFEADGGRWKLEAQKSIKQYLEDNLHDVDNVIVTN